MIKDKQFYYEMIRKYTAIILGLFKHIHYFSYENEEPVYKPLNIKYAQGEKYIKDIINKIDTDQNIARILPILCISLKDLKPLRVIFFKYKFYFQKQKYYKFKLYSFFKVFFAAFCSESFLLLPLPLPTTLSSIIATE